jgi:protein associated with RNAse G/E
MDNLMCLMGEARGFRYLGCNLASPINWVLFWVNYFSVDVGAFIFKNENQNSKHVQKFLLVLKPYNYISEVLQRCH